MTFLRILLLALVCFCAPACQPTFQSATGAPFTPRPIKAQEVVFKRSYYSLEQVDQRPVGIHLPVPRYPKEPREAGVEGKIHLAVAVDEKGNVSEVGTFAASDERFATSVKETVLQWKFKPARKNGKAVGVWMLMPVRFSLK